MMAAASPLVWYTTRATGAVALVLLTGTVALGILTATRVRTTSMPRFAVTDLHRRISLLSLAFLVVHILTAALDSFVHIGLLAAVVPFASHYRPLVVGLGTVAFDLLLAVVATSLLRNRLPANLWRGVHWLVYASWPVALLHGITSGTDIRFGWMDGLVAVCVISVLAALAWRFYAEPHRGGLRTARNRRSAAATVPIRVEKDRRLVSTAGGRGRAR
jgi:predicted ferric reductase